MSSWSFARPKALGTASAMFLWMSSPSMAQTLIVDDDHPGACTCLYPTTNNNPACGTVQNPFACIRDAVTTTRTFDAVSVRDGNYAECIRITKSGVSSSQPFTVAAENPGGALINCSTPNTAAVLVQANYVTLRNFRITGGFDGVYILGEESGSGLGNGNVVEDSEIYGNSRGVHLQRNCSDTRLTRLQIHHNTLYDGLKLDTYPTTTRITNTVLEYSHLHHNVGGVFESGGAERTWVHHNEIDNNGRSGFDHGLYLKGFEGLIQDNQIHHNSGHGITLWAAPRGSDTRHYIVERNDVFANGASLTYPWPQCAQTTFQRDVGAGISVGGTPGEASPPGDGLPHKVEVRYNIVHHNIGPGLYYLVDSCTSSDDGNVFHHNTVYDNAQELLLVRAAGTKVRIKNNIFGSSTGTLVEAYAANLTAGALNGNLYEQPGSSPDSDLFLWNGFLYSFNEVRSPGVLQSATCGTTSGGDPRAIFDALSQSSSDVRFVDRTTARWNDPSTTHHGDFHLRIGSPARSNGICCPESSGGADIDGEAPYVCPTQQCQTDASVGIGADSYLDSDADGTADRYDCEPFNGANPGLCDPDEYSQLVEEYYCAPTSYPGAPYDPAVFPPFSGFGEMCDGKDNDCNPGTSPAGGELDSDVDGFFAGCGGDCAPADPRTFPGSQQVCDGKNNDCSDPNWPAVPAGETDADHDGYFVCSSTCTWNCDCNDSNCAVNLEASEICNRVDDNCSGVIDEGFPDSDSDQVADCVDNCPTVANTNQNDSDQNGVGNMCQVISPPPFDGVGPEDARIQETGENTNLGGTLENQSTSTALRIGDTSNKRQYRSILSFDTSSLPDDAIVTSATLTIKRGGSSGTAYTGTFGTAWVDIGAPIGTNALQSTDWQQSAGVVTQVGTLSQAPSNGTNSTATLNAAGLAAVGKTPTQPTQFRIRFNGDDDNDGTADYIGYHSGEAASANRPKLTLQYVTP